MGGTRPYDVRDVFGRVAFPGWAMSWSARLAWWRLLATRGHLSRYIAARLLVYTGASRFLLIRRRGYTLRFYPSSVSSVLWTDPANRDEDEAFLHRYLRAGDHVIDVGANIGNFALAAASIVGGAGRVVAVEAHPATHTYLQGNVALNPTLPVTTIAAALGETTGEVMFSDSRADDQNAVGTSGEGVRVPLCPLDTLDLPAGPIALLKVDVEGYEEPVFRGGAATLARTACVYFESWETLCARYGRTSTTVLRLLADAGFALYRFGGIQSLSPVEASHVSASCENLLAVRDSSAFFARWNAGSRDDSGGSPFR